MTQGSRSPAILLAAIVFCGHAWFYNGAGDNQNARLDAVFAFVEPGHAESGTFRIDRFIVAPDFNTGDWARGGGHFYSNKAPGSTLLSVPLYELLFRLERARGADPSTLRLTSLNSYVLNLGVSALPVSIAAAALFWFLTTRGWRRSDAAIAAFVFAFGTLVYPFDSQMWGHTTAAAFLCGSYVLLFRHSARAAAFSGLLAGLAVLTDHLAVGPVAVFVGTMLIAIARRGPEALRRTIAFAAGAVPAALALFAYDVAAFGSLWKTAPSASNPIFLDPHRLGGVFGRPSLHVAIRLLVSLDRGALVYMPVLAFVTIGWLYARRDEREEIAVAAAASVVLFGMVTSFNGWDGGWSSGPRYLIVGLPFAARLLPRFSSMPLLPRIAFAVAALVSVANMFTIAASTPMAWQPTNPLCSAFYPALARGEVQPCDNTVIRLTGCGPPEQRALSCFSAGQWLGLTKPRSAAAGAVPILAAFAVIVALRREERQGGATSAGRSST